MMQKIKLPIIILAALFAGFFVYNKFMKKDVSVDLIKTPALSIASPDNNILSLLLKLKDISFDTEIFNDPIFQSLEDFGKKIEAEEAGRVNPFAPSFSAGATSTIKGPTFEQVPTPASRVTPQSNSQSAPQNNFLFSQTP